MNLVIIKANLTRDPELQFLQGGTALVKLGIAANRKWKTDQGEVKEEVSFFNCTGWGKTAETITKYFRKGDPILLTGRLKQDQWEDAQTKQKRSTVNIIVERFEFCGQTKGGEAAGGQPNENNQAPAPASGGQPGADSNAIPGEDDVPF